MPDHLSYQRKLEQLGQLVPAGPMSDSSGAHMQGDGLVVYRLNGLDEAIQLAENDPMHISGARKFTLRKWLVNEGNPSINVGLYKGTATLS